MVEDFNGDLIPDILIPDASNDILVMYKGNPENISKLNEVELSDISFFKESYLIEVGDFPENIVAGNWEAKNAKESETDLYPDIAVINRDDDNISVVFNDGEGKFPQLPPLEDDGLSEEERYHLVFATNDDPTQIVSGDWNNDGFLDLAVLSLDKERINIFLNIPRPLEEEGYSETRRSFKAIRTVCEEEPEIFSDACVIEDELPNDINVGDDPESLISGDWDGDGYWDMAITNQEDDKITLLYGNGKGKFEILGFRVERDCHPYNITAKDINNDGVMDFFMNNMGKKDISVLLSNGNGNRPSSYDTGAYNRFYLQPGTGASGNQPSNIIVEDINGDNKLDILVILPFDEKLSILLQK